MARALSLTVLLLSACRIGLGGPDVGDTDAGTEVVDLSHPDAALPVSVMVGKYYVGQTCSGTPANDPVDAFIDVTFGNATGAPLGPYHIFNGRVLDGTTMATLVTFSFEAADDFTIASMGQKEFQLAKAANTAVPVNRCNTLACNAPVRVAVDWGPAGAARATQSTVSASIPVTCL